jgi:hypothetical protein
MSNPYRAMIAQLAAALQQQVFLDPEIDGNHLPRLAESLLTQPEPAELTDYDLDNLASEFLDWNREGLRAFARAAIAADRARRHG